MKLGILFYLFKKLIPRNIQIRLRRIRASCLRSKYANIWPINEENGEQPENWRGWPEKKQFALVLTHDVESKNGLSKCRKLAQLDRKHGFRSVFNFIPEKYNVPEDLRHYLASIDFEIGVHGVVHDGKLFQSRSIFNQRAVIINSYLKEWGALGFRAPAMHHNLDWLQELHIEYDLSTFDTDPFEPQSDGVNTIFPFWVPRERSDDGYVEMPYTLAQDHGLFIILKEENIDIWIKKMDWIVQKGGMVLLNTHPDYMNFNGQDLTLEEYPATYYEEFLVYIKNNYTDLYWHTLPKELAKFWTSQYK